MVPGFFFSATERAGVGKRAPGPCWRPSSRAARPLIAGPTYLIGSHRAPLGALPVFLALPIAPPLAYGRNLRSLHWYSKQTGFVPGPIAGAGLPGLMFASGGLLAWWRRKKK